MQYGYPQWGHPNGYATPTYGGWPPQAPQGFGAPVPWGTNGSWPSNVGYPTNRPANYPTSNTAMAAQAQNFPQSNQNNQNSGPYGYQPGPAPSNPVAAPRPTNPSNSNASNTGTNQRPAGSQPAAPRRDSSIAPSATRPTHSQNQPAAPQNAQSSGAAKSSAQPPAQNASAEANDNYNTGIKLQEVRIGTDKALKIMKITPGSSAELCGVIHVGDRLVKIGDVEVYSSYDTARVRDLLSGPRGSRIWMAFENALRAEFEVELVRNVRSMKRSTSESTQQAPAPSLAPAAPAMIQKPAAVAIQARKPEETKQNTQAGAPTRPVQGQAPNSSIQNRPVQAQKGVNGLNQAVSNMQIRADPNKSSGNASRPGSAQANPTSRPSQNPAVANMQNRGAQAQAQNNQQQQQQSSQIIYGSRPVTGPFGQYNSMQYTIIGGSLAGSVVGGSHAGSVVGDSLTPSLVIGDWFGGDYV